MKVIGAAIGVTEETIAQLYGRSWAYRMQFVIDELAVVHGEPEQWPTPMIQFHVQRLMPLGSGRAPRKRTLAAIEPGRSKAVLAASPIGNILWSPAKLPLGEPRRVSHRRMPAPFERYTLCFPAWATKTPCWSTRRRRAAVTAQELARQLRDLDRQSAMSGPACDVST
jgi:hypothetical protein